MKTSQILLAKPGQPCQSSVLYRYSNRLSWSFFPNQLHRAIQAKRAQGAPLIDLTVSNPTTAFSNYPHDAIRTAYANIQDFIYKPDPLGRHETRESICQLYRQRGISLSPDDVFLTASTSEAYAFVFKLFCDPGDEVLVPIPSYPLFEYLAALEWVRFFQYALSYDGRWFVDFTQLEDRISERTKAIVIVNPNNPTGSFLKTDEFDRIIRLAQQHKLAIISDEVFTDYTIHPAAGQVRSVLTDGRTLSFALNGLSKMAGMPQVKLGWVAIGGPESERKIAGERLELILDTYLSVNTPVQLAFDDLLKVGSFFQLQIKSRIASNVAALNVLDVTPAHALHTEAGWSVIIQVPAVLTEDQWTIRLLEERGVITQPGYFFDLSRGSCLVLSLITPEEQFRQGLEAIAAMANYL